MLYKKAGNIDILLIKIFFFLSPFLFGLYYEFSSYLGQIFILAIFLIKLLKNKKCKIILNFSSISLAVISAGYLFTCIYAVDKDGRFIGYVIFHDYDEDSVEIGWVLHPKYWRKGYATHLTKLLKERALSSKKQVVIECSPKQEVTKHIAFKNGFSYEGLINGLDVFRFKR